MPLTPNYVPSSSLHAAIRTLAAGRAGEPQVISASNRAASGKIAFTANFTAGDTLIINGMTWTMVASGATAAQVNIAGTLTLSLDAIVTALNASADSRVTPATYSKTGGGTELTAVYDTAGDAGNSFRLGENTTATSTITQMSGGIATQAVSMETENTLLTVASGTDAITLPDGVEFQKKVIVMTGAGTVTMTSPTAKLPLTTYTFNGADSLILQWLSGSWKIILNTGVAAV
jgi:hypothetical protein